MKHPTKAQVQVVIDNLTKAAELAGGDCPVDMDFTGINFDHPCGSPACHGGWYALAVLGPVDRFGVPTDYSDGAYQMAKHLGFEGRTQLELWAKYHPEKWGSNGGHLMFQSWIAFNVPISHLSQIIDHWKGVQSRLPE